MTSLASLRLLGGFLLDYQGESITIVSQRLQSLLAYLALRRNEPQPRQRLAFLLWPDSSEMQAHTNLRTLLHRLHTVIPEIDGLLQIDTQMVAWQPVDSCYLDVADFEEALQQAESS